MEPIPFPSAIPKIKYGMLFTIFARLTNIGNTFKISARAIAQHPVKTPENNPNMLVKTTEPGNTIGI